MQGEPIAGYDADVEIWREWGRLTRFLESARLAFARERSFLGSIEFARPEAVKLSLRVQGGDYTVALDEHLDAVGDEEMLLTSVLIHSYALAEWAAARHFRVDARSFEGIEDWGERLLAANGRKWSDIEGGRAGAVEVAVVRNGFAHADRIFDDREIARLRAAGANGWKPGDRMVLNYPRLRRYRTRLRSLLNEAGVA
jgi:hypothetical protein